MIKQEENERTIRAIRTAGGSVMTTQVDISATMTAHFRQLYSSWPADHKLRTHCLVLPRKVIKTLEKNMTVREGLEVANSKLPSSALGPDGLPYQVYTLVPAMMGLLMRVCQWILILGEVPASWNVAYIRCLLKKGKDKLLPESYQPISLICTDCKIFTSILATRLQSASGEIFGLEQTEYLKGRNTAMAALRVADYFSRHNRAFPVLLDYEKAYDRVDHGWVDVCLSQAGVSQKLRRVLMALLRGMKSRLIINRGLGEWFANGSGVRQGDPLSPLLFLFCIHLLLARLTELKVFTHAHCDDMVVAVHKHSISKVLKALRQYDSATGAAVNLNKSVLISATERLGFRHPF